MLPPGICKESYPESKHTHTKKKFSLCYYIEASLFLLAKFRQKAKLNIKKLEKEVIIEVLSCQKWNQ
jgi:hypothetical protein